MDVELWVYHTAYGLLVSVLGLKAWRYGCMDGGILKLSENLMMQG
jgi:hypothetical protein